MTPETLNAIIIGGALIFCIVGAFMGIIKQLSSVVALVLGLAAGRFFGVTVAETLDVNIFVCSAVLAVLVYIAVIIVAKVLKKAVHKLFLGPIDRLLGAAFGVFFWFSLSSLLLNLLIVCAPETDLSESALALSTLDFLPWIIGCASTYI